MSLETKCLQGYNFKANIVVSLLLCASFLHILQLCPGLLQFPRSLTKYNDDASAGDNYYGDNGQPPFLNEKWSDLLSKAYERSTNRLIKLGETACSGYYDNDRNPFIDVKRRSRNNLLLVQTREDNCKGGVRDVIPRHVAQDILIIPELKLVYLEVRKAGSSSIRAFFSKRYNTSFDHCPPSFHDSRCNGPFETLNSRCSSLCLNDTIIQDYFIFSVVRDPMARFYSSLKESLHQKRIKIESRGDLEYLLKVQMTNLTCKYDHHLESQLMSISTPFRGKSGHRQVPLDFLGDTDDLAEDLVTILILAKQKASLPIDLHEMDVYFKELSVLKSRTASLKDNKLLNYVDGLRDVEMDALVEKAYGQDFVCLT